MSKLNSGPSPEPFRREVYRDSRLRRPHPQAVRRARGITVLTAEQVANLGDPDATGTNFDAMPPTHEFRFDSQGGSAAVTQAAFNGVTFTEPTPPTQGRRDPHR